MKSAAYTGRMMGSRTRFQNNPRKTILWGLALVIAGVIFCAEQFGMMDLTSWRAYFGWHSSGWFSGWPLIVAVAGLINLLSARNFSEALHGAFTAFAGLWIHACLIHLWGWTFADTWPVMAIAFGMGMVARGLHRSINRNETES